MKSCPNNSCFCVVCFRRASRYWHGPRSVLPADTCRSRHPSKGQLSPPRGNSAAVLCPHSTGQTPALIFRTLGLFHLKQFTQHSFFVFQPDSDAEKPYITSDYSFDLTGAGKLRVYKGLMRPSQLGMWPRCPSSPSRQTQCWDWIFNSFSLISRFIRTELTLLTSDTVTWTSWSPVVDEALVCRWHSWSKPARP